MRKIQGTLALTSFLGTIMALSGSVQATGPIVMGAETGHSDATHNACGIAEYNLSPAVGCMNTGASSSNSNFWHIPLPTITSSGTPTVITATGVARAGTSTGGFQGVSGRLLGWFGLTLTCATSFVPFTSTSWSALSLGSCPALNWTQNKAVAEFSMGHTSGLNASGASTFDPGVLEAQYSF